MQKPVNQRQLTWLSSESILTAERFLSFVSELQGVADFGPIQHPSVTFGGGVLPVQLTGVPEQVLGDFEQITDKRFTSANFNAVFPNTNNLTVTVNVNFAYVQVSTIIQNGTDEAAGKIFLMVSEAFPRTSGPSDQEIEQQSLRLSALIKEAEKAVQASKESQISRDSAGENEKSAQSSFATIQATQTESEKLLNDIKKFLEEIK